MTQQYPFGNANDRYKKRLFVETGLNWMEVNAKIVEPYSSPTPQYNNKEIKMINAPSHLQGMGISSYQVRMGLLFPDKQSFADYVAFSGWTHKFYDEKGSIYLGSVTSIKSKAVEASTRYKVEIDLIMVKKDQYDDQDRFEFQDIEGHWAQNDIEEMSNLGLVTVITRDGQPVLYFRPNDYITRAEFITFLNRTRRLMEQILRE